MMNPTASSVDGIDFSLATYGIQNRVLPVGHFKRALPAKFWRAPKASTTLVCFPKR